MKLRIFLILLLFFGAILNASATSITLYRPGFETGGTADKSFPTTKQTGVWWSSSTTYEYYKYGVGRTGDYVGYAYKVPGAGGGGIYQQFTIPSPASVCVAGYRSASTAVYTSNYFGFSNYTTDYSYSWVFHSAILNTWTAFSQCTLLPAGSHYVKMGGIWQDNQGMYFDDITLDYVVNNTPNIPTLNAHADYHNSGTTTVTWQASSDTDGDPITYDVRVGTSSGASNVLSESGLSGTTSSSFSIAPTNTYYWSARTCDVGSCSAWATEDVFVFTNAAPSVPQISYPTNNSHFYNNSINITWSQSTDTDSDTLTYHYQMSNLSDFSNYILEGNTSNNYTGSLSTKDDDINYTRVRSYDGYDYSAWSNTITVYPESITLYYPINSSTINLSAPLDAVNLTWSKRGLSYHLLIAKDNSFAQEVTNTILTTNYSNQYLSIGQQYWWKVQQYNSTSGTYYSWSNVSTFTISSTFEGGISPDGSTGIQGVVYELIDDVITPISKANVFISNTTWTSNVITGSNGYYLFKNLANNSLYTLQATKQDYENSVVELVTTVNGTWSVKNIVLQKCTGGLTCYYTQEYQTIIVKRVNGTELPSALVTIFEEPAGTSVYSSTTDTYGYVKFLLFKDQLYRVVVTKANEGISHTEYFYSSSSPYVITVGTLSYATPSATPYSNVTSYSVNYTARAWSIQNFSSAYLTSQLGIGSYGQGVLTGTVNWVIVGSGGWLTCILASAIMAYLGLISWTVILFFALTALSLFVLTKM